MFNKFNYKYNTRPKDTQKPTKPIIAKLLETNIPIQSNRSTNKFVYKFKSTYNPVVPLNIFQTWHTKNMLPGMYYNVQFIKRIHPLFTYYLYDDNDCREFIKNNFEPDVLMAFDTLIPGAYKADLWRYCILYKMGGIYLDIKFKPTNGFNLIELTEKEHFVRDVGGVGVYNGVMVCKQGNPLLLRCINKIIENVKNRYYGTCFLSITGPTLLASMMEQNDKTFVDMHLENPLEDLRIKERQHLVMYKGICILSIYKKYRDEQRKTQKTLPYSILWHIRQIYI